MLLAATEPLAAEALLRRTCWELLEEGLDVAAEELLRTTWPFWEPEVALLRVAELLRVTELEEELLRVAEPEELLPEVVVPLRTWLDWVGAVADRVEEELEEERTALEELYHEQIAPAKEKGLAAAVYTQISDVEDELNGLMTYDRRVVKIAPEILKTIVDMGK